MLLHRFVVDDFKTRASSNRHLVTRPLIVRISGVSPFRRPVPFLALRLPLPSDKDQKKSYPLALPARLSQYVHVCFGRRWRLRGTRRLPLSFHLPSVCEHWNLVFQNQYFALPSSSPCFFVLLKFLV